MEFTNRTAAVKQARISTLTSVSENAKHKKSLKYGELVLTLYLAPANSSGYEVCPGRTAECTKLCLNESGKNSMVRKDKGDVINNARRNRTKLFFEDRKSVV